MTPETFTALTDELDAIEGVIFHLQQDRATNGAKSVRLTHDAPNVHHLHPEVTLPGAQWQALEAMKGLAWVLRTLCEEMRGGWQ